MPNATNDPTDTAAEQPPELNDALSRPRPVPDPSGDIVARLLAESPISLSAAAGIFAEFWRGRRPHPGTIARWGHRGHKLADGTVVKLEMIACGGLWLTSRAAIARYLRAQQPTAPVEIAPMRSRSARQRAAARAITELTEGGAI